MQPILSLSGQTVVLETDFCTDVDDVAALALLCGEAKARPDAFRLGGVSCNVKSPFVAAAVKTVLSAWGMQGVPVGVTEDPLPPSGDRSDYLAGLAARRGILMEYDKDIVREHFVFHGHVQGVGFRYQAMYAARNYGVTGWVENLSDGSVEMEAQGTPQAIAMVLARIRNARWIRIDEMQVDEMPLQEGERGFGLRGY